MKKFRRSPADLVLVAMIAIFALVGQPPGYADQVTIKADRDAHNNPWALGNPNNSTTNIWQLVDWKYIEPGGWGDFRVGFWHYNCSALPANVTSFVASLYCLPRGDSSTNMEMDFWIPNVPWSETTCFPKTGPSGYNFGRLAATPTPNKWFSIELASVYNHATYGPLLRANGFMLVPRATNNNFNVFASSEYATTSYRPKAVVNYLKLKFPLPGGYVSNNTSSGFGDWWEGEMSENGLYKLLHTGIDVAANAGTTVYSSANGTVKHSTPSPQWGGYVAIEHTEPNGKKYCTVYEHLIPSVAVGQTITKGQVIGKISTLTNRRSHLHFAVFNKAFENTWTIRGRLPEQQSYVIDLSNNRAWEPGFPYYFLDPEKVVWQ